MNPLFRIKNLECAYSSGPTVIRMEDLEIPREKLIFVIGKSGVGKSTFIETLGLMNQTIKTSSESSLLFYTDENSIELKNIWEDPQISEIRKKHYSFIFQNTNLMPNFTAGENMMTNLLMSGFTIKQAKERVLVQMNKLDLDERLFDKQITELSGGQRQRLAFVRAITADFTVLFGDEPTGNLDENTAQELMKILSNSIREDKKSGIIVSHDLKLAQKFADVIIPIVPNSDSSIIADGVVLQSNFLFRNDENWMDTSGKSIDDPRQYLKGILQQELHSIYE